jgi:hypothetical protein
VTLYVFYIDVREGALILGGTPGTLRIGGQVGSTALSRMTAKNEIPVPAGNRCPIVQPIQIITNFLLWCIDCSVDRYSSRQESQCVIICVADSSSLLSKQFSTKRDRPNSLV